MSIVALRKESVDRNYERKENTFCLQCVALRKESVDRNCTRKLILMIATASLSARRAWIEIRYWTVKKKKICRGRSPQGERG